MAGLVVVYCATSFRPPFDIVEQRERERDRDNAFFRPHFLQSDSLRIGQRGREGDIDGKWQKILPCLVVVFGCADAYSFGGFIDLALKNK